MSVEDGSAGVGDVGSHVPAERLPAGYREEAPGACPRCGSSLPVRATGRPARWCSQQCRRAAYEERRAAAAGAIAVAVVETVTTTEHGLDECVRRVQASPVAVRKTITHLTELAAKDRIRDPKWGTFCTARRPAKTPVPLGSHARLRDHVVAGESRSWNRFDPSIAHQQGPLTSGDAGRRAFCVSGAGAGSRSTRRT
jgi:hypothetical protein